MKIYTTLSRDNGQTQVAYPGAEQAFCAGEWFGPTEVLRVLKPGGLVLNNTGEDSGVRKEELSVKSRLKGFKDVGLRVVQYSEITSDDVIDKRRRSTWGTHTAGPATAYYPSEPSITDGDLLRSIRLAVSTRRYVTRKGDETFFVVSPDTNGIGRPIPVEDFVRQIQFIAAAGIDNLIVWGFATDHAADCMKAALEWIGKQ